MIKTTGKFSYMIVQGFKYIRIYKRTFFHPFISQQAAYMQLSKDRQRYSNKILDYLNIKVNLIGEIPTKDNMLYAINHRSLLDIIVMENIFSKYNKNGTWIAKQELFDAIYGNFFRYSGCISVDLESGRGLLSFFKKIKNTLGRVKNFNIYMFPEGERHSGDGILNFQSGAAKIAKANKLEIVPVFINDRLEDVFKNAPYKEVKTVDVHVGDVIKHQNIEKDYKEFMEKIKND